MPKMTNGNSKWLAAETLMIRDEQNAKRVGDLNPLRAKR